MKTFPISVSVCQKDIEFEKEETHYYTVLYSSYCKSGSIAEPVENWECKREADDSCVEAYRIKCERKYRCIEESVDYNKEIIQGSRDQELKKERDYRAEEDMEEYRDFRAQQEIGSVFDPCEDLMSYLGSCLAYSCEQSFSPESAFVVKHTVVGFRDGKCHYVQTVHDTDRVQCHFSSEGRKKIILEGRIPTDIMSKECKINYVMP